MRREQEQFPVVPVGGEQRKRAEQWRGFGSDCKSRGVASEIRQNIILRDIAEKMRFWGG